MVWATSSAVKGVPSEKLSPERSWKVIRLPLRSSFQLSARSGSSAWLDRFTRISTPPVRYRTTSDGSSSTSSGLKVLGSPCRQKRSSPPYWPNAAGIQASTTRPSTNRNFMLIFILTSHDRRRRSLRPSFGVHRQPVFLPGLLGLVHTLIGLSQQLFRVGSIIGIASLSHAHRDAAAQRQARLYFNLAELCQTSLERLAVA